MPAKKLKTVSCMPTIMAARNRFSLKLLPPGIRNSSICAGLRPAARRASSSTNALAKFFFASPRASLYVSTAPKERSNTSRDIEPFVAFPALAPIPSRTSK